MWLQQTKYVQIYVSTEKQNFDAISDSAATDEEKPRNIGFAIVNDGFENPGKNQYC